MSATRRGFLQGLLGGAAAVVASPALPTPAPIPVPMVHQVIASGDMILMGCAWDSSWPERQRAAAQYHADLIDDALFRRLT